MYLCTRNRDNDTKKRDVAQLASAPRSGRGGRKFESSHPDEIWPNLFNINKLGHIGLYIPGEIRENIRLNVKT